MGVKGFKFKKTDYKILEREGGKRSIAAIGAKFFKVSKTTMERALRSDAGAREALERGRHNSIGEIESVAYKMAKSGKNTAMTTFYLKTRAGYRETQRVELTGRNGGPIETSELTPEQRREKLKKLRKFMDVTDEEHENPFDK